MRGSLEIELHSQFNDSIALLRRGRPKVRTGIGEAPVCVLREGETQVTAVKRPQRVIQEIGRLNTELKFHGLLYLEVLEQPEVGIEESWSVRCRDEGRAILADCGGRRETALIDELMRT
jgi:hypothetical protein